MADEVLRELWAVKDQIAKEHGSDLRRLFEHLKSLEAASSAQVVDRSSTSKKPTTST